MYLIRLYNLFYDAYSIILFAYDTYIRIVQASILRILRIVHQPLYELYTRINSRKSLTKGFLKRSHARYMRLAKIYKARLRVDGLRRTFVQIMTFNE